MNIEARITKKHNFPLLERFRDKNDEIENRVCSSVLQQRFGKEVFCRTSVEELPNKIGGKWRKNKYIFYLKG